MKVMSHDEGMGAGGGRIEINNPPVFILDLGRAGVHTPLSASTPNGGNQRWESYSCLRLSSFKSQANPEKGAAHAD